jgi:hypothetical protein
VAAPLMLCRWNVDAQMTYSLVIDALQLAFAMCKLLGFICHSGRNRRNDLQVPGRPSLSQQVDVCVSNSHVSSCGMNLVRSIDQASIKR